MTTQIRRGSGLALCIAALALPTAHAGPVDTKALVAQVPLCRVAHAFVKAPCAGKLLGETLLPYLAPIEVSGLKASKTILKLDTDDWKSKAASWVNKGLDWLGVPDRYRVPKELKVEVGIAVRISDIRFRMPKGQEYQPEFGATIGISLQLLNTPLRGTRFASRGRVEGKMYLTVAPLKDECLAKKPDWAAAIINLHLTKLDVDRIPNWIDGNDLYLALVNWAVSRKYEDYPQYATRGIPVCLKGNCPIGRTIVPVPASQGLMNLTGMQIQNPMLKIARRADGGLVIDLRDASLLCKVTRDVMNAGCTDAFVSSMANAVLPLRVPVPDKLAGPGLQLSADKLSLDLRNPRAPVLAGAASLSKAGQQGAFRVGVRAKVELAPQCTRDSFLVLMRPTIEDVSVSPLPSWLVNGVARSAVNGFLKPMDFCFGAVKVPKVGKTVNLCKLTDAMLREQCTAALVSAIADAALPLTVEPAKATPLRQSAPLQQMLSGISLTVQKAHVASSASDPKHPSVTVGVALRKAGARGALSTEATATFGVEMKCGKERNALRVTPFVSNLKVSAIPEWLLRATVVNMGNAAISKWQAICAYGNCKDKQHIDVGMPNLGLPKAKAAAAPACNFDAFVAGSK